MSLDSVPIYHLLEKKTQKHMAKKSTEKQFLILFYFFHEAASPRKTMPDGFLEGRVLCSKSSVLNMCTTLLNTHTNSHTLFLVSSVVSQQHSLPEFTTLFPERFNLEGSDCISYVFFSSRERAVR